MNIIPIKTMIRLIIPDTRSKIAQKDNYRQAPKERMRYLYKKTQVFLKCQIQIRNLEMKLNQII